MLVLYSRFTFCLSFNQAYIDGNLQNSSQAVNFEQFGGGKLWIGSRGWNNAALPIFDSTDMPFTGSVDEIRIWQTSRLLEQIRRDKNNRLTGNESGLVLYLPFESYAEVMGFPILNVTPVDLVSGGTSSFTAVGTSAFNQESPTIKLPRPVQDINFSYSVNNDEIIITPTTSNEFIENDSKNQHKTKARTTTRQPRLEVVPLVQLTVASVAFNQKFVPRCLLLTR